MMRWMGLVGFWEDPKQSIGPYHHGGMAGIYWGPLDDPDGANGPYRIYLEKELLEQFMVDLMAPNGSSAEEL